MCFGFNVTSRTHVLKLDLQRGNTEEWELIGHEGIALVNGLLSCHRSGILIEGEVLVSLSLFPSSHFQALKGEEILLVLLHVCLSPTTA